ncbi:MAG: hypothetical protein QM760_21835, partial [Nibricoccus sp.]
MLPDRSKEYQLILGDDPRGTDHDLLTLAKLARKQNKLPKLRIDCGTEDFLLEPKVLFGFYRVSLLT